MALFLVTAEYIDPGSLLPPAQVAEIIGGLVIPSFEAMAKLQDQKKILAGGIVAGERAGAFIIDAASHGDLSKTLQELPFWGLVKWTSRPLQPFRERAAEDAKVVERIKAMIK